MPLYRNPDFRRLPSGLAGAFDNGSRDSFFALPAWYDLMARYGVPRATEIRVYTDERRLRRPPSWLRPGRRTNGGRLASLTNAHSLEHGMLYAPGADLEHDPRRDSVGDVRGTAAMGLPQPVRTRSARAELRRLGARFAPRRAARRILFQLRHLVRGDGRARAFLDYVAARPSELRNTWRRKRRRLLNEATG